MSKALNKAYEKLMSQKEEIQRLKRSFEMHNCLARVKEKQDVRFQVLEQNQLEMSRIVTELEKKVKYLENQVNTPKNTGWKK